MKLKILFLFMFISSIVTGQTKPDNFSFATQPAKQYDYSINGYSSDNNYSDNTTYHLYFGQTWDGSSASPSNDNIIDGITLGTYNYSVLTACGGESYSKVVVNRVANDNVSDLDKQTIFFKKATEDGTDRYYTCSYTKIDETVNSRILDRGADNTFSNANSGTLNNVERIDMIITAGVKSHKPDSAGFLILERGGNDNVKVAAITGLDANDEVSALGDLLTVVSSDWQSTGTTIESTVFKRNSVDSDMRPDQDLSSQDISGVFVSYSDLGITDGNTKIYGYAIFPGDVDNNTMDLIGLSDVPTDTDGSSGTEGGLDLMGGSAFFVDDNLPVIDVETLVKPAIQDTSPKVGDMVTMKIYARNHGPVLDYGSSDQEVTLNIDIPDGYSYQSVLSNSASSESSTSYNTSTRQLTWTFPNGINAVREADSLEVEVETLSSGNRTFTSDINLSSSNPKEDISPDNNTKNYELLTYDEQGLPVELLYFKGESMKNSNILSWKTASEINNDYFLLEKSDNGTDYTAIATIKGAGSSNAPKDYSFRDKQITSELSYYRLTQYDFDGKSKQYKPIVIECKNLSGNVKVFPNPANREINIANINSGDQLQVIDCSGRILINKTASATSLNLDLNQIPAGIYYIKITNGMDTTNRKFIVQ